MVSSADVLEAKQRLEHLKLAAAFGRAGPPREDDQVEDLKGSTESVFIDVFSEEGRPFDPKNVAMLYVVGPKGEGCTGPKSEGSGALLETVEEFLDTVKRMAATSVRSIAEYNQLVAEGSGGAAGLPAIEEIRWCLVSGGVYCHSGSSKVDVAEATLQGMLSVKGVPLTITFTYDQDSFRLADERLKGVQPPPQDMET